MVMAMVQWEQERHIRLPRYDDQQLKLSTAAAAGRKVLDTSLDIHEVCWRCCCCCHYSYCCCCCCCCCWMAMCGAP
jgi:hypothetical protein